MRKGQAEMSGLSLWNKQQVFMILSFFIKREFCRKNFLTFRDEKYIVCVAVIL